MPVPEGMQASGMSPLIALIGRDFLQNAMLVYNGPEGHFSLAMYRQHRMGSPAGPVRPAGLATQAHRQGGDTMTIETRRPPPRERATAIIVFPHHSPVMVAR